MAFSATTEWEVRTTGAADNGGGFDTASSGTDYCQQDAAQVTYTDLVIDGATNTKLTSAATPFTSNHVGNIINITSGTGFTVQRVQIVSVAASVATCDKSCGTVGSTGGNGKLGGALLTIGAAAGLCVEENTVHVKAGTYTLTAQVSWLKGGVLVVGYGSTRYDLGTKPVVTTATDSTTLFAHGTSGNYDFIFVNFKFTNTASVRAAGIQAGGGNRSCVAYNCLFDGCSYGISGSGGASFVYFLRVVDCEIKNCTSGGIRVSIDDTTLLIIDSYIHDNTGDGALSATSSGQVILLRSIFDTNSGDGYRNSNNSQLGQHYVVRNCVFYGNGGDGMQPGNGGGGLTRAQTIEVVNNIFYSNGGYGINSVLAPKRGGANRANAYGANGTAPTLNMVAGTGDVTLTADPFTNAAGGDFSLNNTAGGGAALREAGYSPFAGFPDVGAVEFEAPVGGGLLVNPGMSGGMRG